jgi:hypothetical protein
VIRGWLIFKESEPAIPLVKFPSGTARGQPLNVKRLGYAFEEGSVIVRGLHQEAQYPRSIAFEAIARAQII